MKSANLRAAKAAIAGFSLILMAAAFLSSQPREPRESAIVPLEEAFRQWNNKGMPVPTEPE